MKMDYSSYEVIEFKDLSSNFPKKCRGMLVGTSLVVSSSDKKWKIYLLNTGKPIINVLFINLEDAVKIAEWLDNIFSEYFPILETYPDADLFGMVKWSVDDGIRIFEALKLVRTKRVVCRKDFTDALREAGKHVRFWTRIGRNS